MYCPNMKHMFSFIKGERRLVLVLISKENATTATKLEFKYVIKYQQSMIDDIIFKCTS